MPIICAKDTISYSYLIFGCRDDADIRSTLDTKVIGVHRVIQACLPLLQSGQKKTIINLGAMIGSMTVISKAVSARQLYRCTACMQCMQHAFTKTHHGEGMLHSNHAHGV